MKCPTCGFENTPSSERCAECDALLPARIVSDDDVDALMAELPSSAQFFEHKPQAKEGSKQERASTSETASESAEKPEAVSKTKLMPKAVPADSPESVVNPDLIEDFEPIYVVPTRNYDHDSPANDRVSDLGTIVHGEPKKKSRKNDPYEKARLKRSAPSEPKKTNKSQALIGVLLIAVLLTGVAVFVAYGAELWGGKSTPSVVGSSQANAEKAIAAKGLAAKVEAQPSDDAIGKVLAQSPEPGTRLEEGSEVTIIVATNRVIPEVVGMSEVDATAALRAAGAESITTTTQSSGQPEGTVIACSPAPGEAFISRRPVEITLAAPYRVPDVLGAKEADARRSIEELGLQVSTSYVASSEEARTVVSQKPEAGEVIAEGGTVELKLSSPYPTNVYHLAEYASRPPQDIDSYLKEQGFSYKTGYTDSQGQAVALYSSPEYGNLSMSSQPWAKTITAPKTSEKSPLEEGSRITGIRLDFVKKDLPLKATSYSKEALNELVAKCGFDALTEFTDNKVLPLSKGVTKLKTSFVAGSGENDNYIWTIAIVGDSKSARASASYTPKSLYSSIDLTNHKNKILNFVTYQEVYE